MSVTDGKIKITIPAVAAIEIPLPVYPYKTTIDLGLDIQKLETGNGYSIYDNGSTYDMRSCEVDFVLSRLDTAILNDIIRDFGRGVAYTLEICTNSQFRPFGPDKNDTSYTVMMEMLSQDGIGDAPYLYFHSKVKLTNAGTYAGTALPTEINDGSFQIGTVDGLRFPPNWFEPEAHYEVDGFVLRDSSAAQFINGGISGDSYDTTCELESNFSKAAALMAYITGTARGGTLSIIAGNNSWPFGRDKVNGVGLGAGTYTVRLIQESITITHEAFNIFKIPLAFNFIGVA